MVNRPFFEGGHAKPGGTHQRFPLKPPSLPKKYLLVGGSDRNANRGSFVLPKPGTKPGIGTQSLEVNEMPGPLLPLADGRICLYGPFFKIPVETGRAG